MRNVFIAALLSLAACGPANLPESSPDLDAGNAPTIDAGPVDSGIDCATLPTVDQRNWCLWPQCSGLRGDALKCCATGRTINDAGTECL